VELEMGTKNDPGKYDCYSRAEPDEPMFVLLGRDPIAPHLVWVWAKVRGYLRGADDKTREAEQCAQKMLEYSIRRDGLNANHSVVLAGMIAAVGAPCRCNGVPSPVAPGARVREYEGGFCLHCGGRAPANA
jgi:hypothetical protein